MAAEVDTVGLNRSDRAGGVDRGVAGNENHAGHVACGEFFVVGLRSGGSALRGGEAEAGDFRRELLQRRSLKSRENERCCDWLERRAGGQAIARGGFARERDLLRLRLRLNLC